MHKIKDELEWFENATKKWYEISEDELLHREMLQEKYHRNPVRLAVSEMVRTIFEVMERYGLKDGDNVPRLMDELGIIAVPNEVEKTPHLNGIFFLQRKKSIILSGTEIIPVAWISRPRAKQVGDDLIAYCDWEDFVKNVKGTSQGVVILHNRRPVKGEILI